MSSRWSSTPPTTTAGLASLSRKGHGSHSFEIGETVLLIEDVANFGDAANARASSALSIFDMYLTIQAPVAGTQAVYPALHRQR
ncbi:hypothetical protein [Frankia sp. CiP1_Cm_nod2]|uniref:hypothetical protein n=1 Tax=Frankia sp. CiP1_Cm_nod2 TaxID=2897161 RepID=UPI002024E966